MNKAEYIGHMGDDLRVVDAARVSFDKQSEWDLVKNENGGVVSKHLNDKDSKLLSYLATHSHWTPFSHCIVTIRETVPIFVARQRFKHMVGFTYNEVSRRYVDDTPEFFEPARWRKRPTNGAKQGSVDGLSEDNQGHFSRILKEIHVKAKQDYEYLIIQGCAPEQARMILPQSMLTSYYVTGSLAAWARAYKLRIDAHSQQEIQDLAVQWDKIIQPFFPVSWEALTK